MACSRLPSRSAIMFLPHVVALADLTSSDTTSRPNFYLMSNAALLQLLITCPTCSKVSTKAVLILTLLLLLSSWFLGT